MLPQSPQNVPQSSFFDITDQLDSTHPLFALGNVISWYELESPLANHYSEKVEAPNPYG